MDIEREGIPVLKDTPHHYEGPSLSKLQTFRLNWRVGSQKRYWYLITSWRNQPENSLLTLSVLPYKFQVNFISVFQSNLDNAIYIERAEYIYIYSAFQAEGMKIISNNYTDGILFTTVAGKVLWDAVFQKHNIHCHWFKIIHPWGVLNYTTLPAKSLLMWGIEIL